MAFWSSRAERDDLDYLSRTNLGIAQLRQARATGDLALLDTAAVSLNDALAINPRYSLALAALATVYLGQHHFSDALTTAEAALGHDAASTEALGALGDAQLELGRYEQAADSYHRLHRWDPGPAAEARLARLAFLTGDPHEAIERAQTALDLAGPGTDPSFHTALTIYALDAGLVDLARDTARAALGRFPNSPAVLETLAMVEAGAGDLEAAVGLYRRLLASGPDPGAHAALGNLYVALGRTDEAMRHYELVESSAESITPDPVVFDREIALFLADRRSEPDRAVEIARRDLDNRQDIYAYDTLAWALYQAGRSQAAAEPMQRALAQGTEDPHLHFHAGMIAEANGDEGTARFHLQRALEINPHFDPVQAPRAVEALQRLN